MLNSILKLSYLENNQKLCDLIFNNSKPFIEQNETFNFLSYSEIFQNLLKYKNQMKNNNYKTTIRNILKNINFNEMMDVFDNMKKDIVDNTVCVEFFLSLLIDNFSLIKVNSKFINEKYIDMLSTLEEIKRDCYQELLKDEYFIKILVELVFLLFNTSSNNYINNCGNFFDIITKILRTINSNENNFKLLLNELFIVLFIQLYSIENNKNKIGLSEKFKIVENKKELSDFEILPLTSPLFNYFKNIINLFCILTPTQEIINEIIYYLYQIQNSYNQLYLTEYRKIANNEIDFIDKGYIMCNFFHIFKSNVIYNFQLYLDKYAKNNNSSVFTLFPEFKKILTNIFNIFDFPKYIYEIFTIIQSEEKLIKEENYINEILEMIMSNELLESNNNIYKIQYPNIIKLLKYFFYISQYNKFNNIFCLEKLLFYFLKFQNILKDCKIIYSNFLITLDINNEKIDKTILEICFLIIISLIYKKKEKNSSKINKCFDFFKIGKKTENLFYIVDMLNKGSEIKDIANYRNNGFEKYLSELNYKKEEKSLLILSFIHMEIFAHKKDKTLEFGQFIIANEVNCYKDISIFFKKYHKFKKTKTDLIYDLIIEQLYSISKSKLSPENINIMYSINENINKNIKRSKELEPLNDISNMEYNWEGRCFLKNNCNISKSKRTNTLLNLGNKPKIQDKVEKFKDYYDFSLPNIVKYFKSDLILKDAAIYFDDIYFNDKNFGKIKKSFLIRHNKNLIGETNTKLFNYPSKLRNFSSNKYAYPKIFLECNNNYYRDGYFHIRHSEVNLNIIKKESFPNLPSHYEYLYDLFLKYSNKSILNIDCELISIKNIIFGKIYVCDKFLFFKNGNKFDEKNLSYIFHSVTKEITLNKKIIIIQWKNIEEIITRTFAYNYQAIEIFLKNGKSYMFNLFNELFLEQIYKEIKKIKSKNPELSFVITESPKITFEKNEFTKKWDNNELSTFQYLLYINKYSGRTYNDINQYPVFPWIFLASELDENNNNKFIMKLRDMSYFPLANYEEGRQIGKKAYAYSSQYGKNISHFLIHYSAAGYIILYLIKISPHTEGNIRLQSGTFDSPDRLIYSFDEFLNSLKKFKDNRELIPELFTMVEQFYNINYIYFGKKNNSKVVHNSIVPKIFNYPEEFIYYNRLILNNQLESRSKNLPTCQINKWIDLVFGVNQYPGDYEKLNKFDDYSYRQIKYMSKRLEKYVNKNYSKETILEKLYMRINKILCFGQCPEVLFNNIHISKKIKEKKDKKENVIHQIKLDFINNENKFITFWIGENKNIFFLYKNDNIKKIMVLIYDENLAKKYEIIIDKIKLFSSIHEFLIENTNFINNNKNNLKDDILNCSIAVDILENANTFNSFLLLEPKEYNNNQINDNFILKDLKDVYSLDPKSSMFDMLDETNIYLFVGRNYDNSIKIYTQNKNIFHNNLFGRLKTDSFVSVIHKINKNYFLTGHKNGKILKWKIEYNKSKKIDNIYNVKEFFAHKYMISYIYYNERHNIVLSSDIKGILYIRKYYDFQLMNKIIINNNYSTFVNKIFINEFDNICTVNYNIYKKKNNISFYSINGILLEESQNIICIDNYFLKNGKMIFNCLNETNLFIFGYNGKDIDNKGKIIEDNILKEIEVKKNYFDYITNFVVDNNEVYIILKDGVFIKEYYEKLDSLSFGVEKFVNY